MSCLIDYNDLIYYSICLIGFYLGWIFNKTLTERYIKADNTDVIKIKQNDYQLLSNEEKLFWKRVRCVSCHKDMRKYFYILGVESYPNFTCESLVCKYNNLK